MLKHAPEDEKFQPPFNHSSSKKHRASVLKIAEEPVSRIIPNSLKLLNDGTIIFAFFDENKAVKIKIGDKISQKKVVSRRINELFESG